VCEEMKIESRYSRCHSKIHATTPRGSFV